MLFDALAEAFRVLGGVPRRGIFDNMRTAVDRIGSGKAREVNARFAAMASHYLFEPTFCSRHRGGRRRGREKRAGAHLLRRSGGDREMVDVLTLVLQHDEQAVLCAVKLALEGGVATKIHMLNLLHRLTDAKGTATAIGAPQALVLTQEPRADIGRYDALRVREVRHAS